MVVCLSKEFRFQIILCHHAVICIGFQDQSMLCHPRLRVRSLSHMNNCAEAFHYDLHVNQMQCVMHPSNYISLMSLSIQCCVIPIVFLSSIPPSKLIAAKKVVRTSHVFLFDPLLPLRLNHPHSKNSVRHIREHPPMFCSGDGSGQHH
jgi:hypothetical protein